MGWDRFVIATICMSHQTRAEGLQDPSAYRVFIYCMCMECGVESFYPTRFAIAIFPYFVSAFYVPPKSLEKN